MPQDLTKFGLIPEFVGRVPIVVTLNSLDETALMKILVEPKNSLVKQYKKLFELDGVQLDFKEDALEAIAKKSLERKTGARGLRAIMEDTMMDLMYEIPSDNTTKECVITKDAVEKKAEPEIIHGESGPCSTAEYGKKIRKTGNRLKNAGGNLNGRSDKSITGDCAAWNNDFARYDCTF